MFSLPPATATEAYPAAISSEALAIALRARSAHPVHGQRWHLHRQRAADGCLSRWVHPGPRLDHLAQRDGIDGVAGQRSVAEFRGSPPRRGRAPEGSFSAPP